MVQVICSMCCHTATTTRCLLVAYSTMSLMHTSHSIQLQQIGISVFAPKRFLYFVYAFLASEQAASTEHVPCKGLAACQGVVNDSLVPREVFGQSFSNSSLSSELCFQSGWNGNTGILLKLRRSWFKLRCIRGTPRGLDAI